MKFKKGDKVRYIHKKDDYFTNGKIYEVRETRADDYTVGLVSDDEGSPNGWMSNYFELVEQDVVFKVGDTVKFIDDSNWLMDEKLVVGRFYKVLDAFGIDVQVTNGGDYFMSKRFELVSTENPKTPTVKISEKVQFKHFPNKRTTRAFCAPSAFELIEAQRKFTQGDAVTIEFKYGESKVHPNDQYSKKIGRAVSENKLEVKQAELYKIKQYQGFAHYYFVQKTDKEVNFEFVLLLTYGKEVPFLLQYVKYE